ncbi:hypothetical protein N7456_002557 [Penicillium angulare]|uniref:Aminoglycoside phosphotransferase domain-containing protein n=1 Tax=Penicillium angulare TaxID=116970 RepID=A0A9W9G8H4_9EURO|nr:hypothetical protein N7456_002557 [Penicillium angulare]
MTDSILSGPREVGSCVWGGFSDWEEDEEVQDRAIQFIEDIEWTKLTAICSMYRDGIPCFVSGSFHSGLFNMVRQVVFEDGISWVARIRMPNLCSHAKGPAGIQTALRSEIAWMKYLWERSSIPVPEVYYYDLGPNKVGAPYILMEYIPGTTATRHCNNLGGGSGIGSLYQDPDTARFYIGPDSKTGKGPFDSALDYYRSLANDKLEDFLQTASMDEAEDCSVGLPVLFEKLMELHYHRRSPMGPFGIASKHFGAGSLLVDENFKILAFNDFECLIAAPVELQAQLPNSCDLGMEIPFHVEIKPYLIQQIRKERPRAQTYQSMILNCEGFLVGPTGNSPSLGEVMLSHAAATLCGLESFGGSKGLNRKWFLAFSRLLRQIMALKMHTDDKLRNGGRS